MGHVIGIRIPGIGQDIEIEQAGLSVGQESLQLLELIAAMHPKVMKAGDLGCGSGLLAIGLACLFPAARILGLDIQPGMVQAATSNAVRNGLQNRVEIRHADVRDPNMQRYHNSYELVVCNPPFRKLNTGRMSPTPQIRMANHEISGGMQDFIRTGALMLKHRGILGIVMLPERLSELLQLMMEHQIPAFVLQSIHHPATSNANACCVLGRKGGKPVLTIRPPVNLESGRNN